MKILKRILLSLLALLLVLSPFLSTLLVAAVVPPQFTNTFYGALNEKVDLLYGTEGKKAVVIGGSSVAFGVDSSLLEEYLDMPVINFGLYAALGTKLMIELSRDAIGEGDLIILAPELDAQTLSLYMNPLATLKAADDDPSLLRHLRFDDRVKMLGALWEFAGEKVAYAREGAPDPTGVYNAANFDRHGDLTYTRLQNEMPLYYDPNSPITLDPTILSAEFVDYINDFVAHCRRRGAEIYFTFCPLNAAAMTDGCDAEAFAALLREKLDCEVIGGIGDAVMNAGYFYDTNFHLNDAGRRAHTVALCSSLLAALWIPASVAEPIPKAPDLAPIDTTFDGYDENERFFTWSIGADGGATLTGLTPLGRERTALTLPLGVDGHRVLIVGEGAFADGFCEHLTVPAGSYLRIFLSGAFRASGISRLDLAVPASQILPPTDFVGTASGLTVHVSPDSTYDTDYYWSERGLTFRKDLAD